ncbi:MAG: hypothetical protein MRJ65_12705 [Candidatus Brocadiaceae bacterium]|nr:hypothetical protein [Candidatus Brocadiaceae bacterium]
MDQLLAGIRMYIIVIVFFASCFLGIMNKVSLPTLAIRSVIITGIVGIAGHLFLKYVASVTNSAFLRQSEKEGDAQNIDRKDKEEKNRGTSA